LARNPTEGHGIKKAAQLARLLVAAHARLFPAGIFFL
jgi:hypothetical protein